MTEWGIAVALSLAGGVALGAVYFAALWWSVCLLPRTRHPQLLLLVSFGVRMALVLLGFYLVMNGRWERAVACLIGFLMARTVMLRRLRPQSDGVMRESPDPSAVRVVRSLRERNLNSRSELTTFHDHRDHDEKESATSHG